MNRTWSFWAVVGLIVAFGLTYSPVGHAQQVVINEIHYHPSSSSVPELEDPENLQFIELYNAGPTPVNLSGWSVTQAVSFIFPGGTTLESGAYLVLAEDPAFLAMFGPPIPGGVQVLQWTSGDLDNGGETVQLVDTSYLTIDQVTYGDEGLWPIAADGSGPSLELVNPGFDNAYPQAWRASAGVDGTPGAVNSRFTDGPVVLYEDPVRSSVVPNLTQVSVTFAEPVVNVVAGDLRVNGSAATSVAGSGAGPYLFSGFTTPTATPVAVELGPGAIQDPEAHPFAGDTWIYALSVPKIVINEIHYHPQDPGQNQNLEFIELVNADSVAVDISNWLLTEFASPGFTFPAGTILDPGEFVVVAKDPSLLPGCTAIVGTWGLNDSLSNGGEPIRLVNTLGVTVDRVVYDDGGTWPTAPDGGGPSAELINPDADNNDGRFWMASAGLNGTCGAQNSTFSTAPLVLSESPARGSVVVSLTEVSVTFTEPVSGVTADDLTVDSIPALSVTGAGAGPYEFSIQPPAPGTLEVVLDAGGIVDGALLPFAGDGWEYFFSLPRIVINEMHYHPADGAVGVGEDPEDLQFLELYNAGTVAIDLSGWSTSGVVFSLPPGTVLDPGAYLVLAKNATFLQATVTIPPGVTVLEWTSGDLSNGGETIELSDSYGHVIDEYTYDDEGLWSSLPDGTGPSLELINPGMPNQYGAAWLPSVASNGTPGAANSVYDSAPAPLISGAGHTPAIPQPGQSVAITVVVIDDGPTPPTVTLFHRLDANDGNFHNPNAYTGVAMFDDGLHADGIAGDLRYGAIVAGLANGDQMDFYVAASDGAKTSVAPALHETLDGKGNPTQTYLLKFSSELLPTDFPVYHILVTLANKQWQESLSGEVEMKQDFDATFIDDDLNVYYNVIERYRGQSSISTQPRSYRVDLPSDRPIDSPLGFPARKLQFNGHFPMRQRLGYELFNEAGLPACKTAWVRLRYPGWNYDTSWIGSSGFYGLYALVERVDSDFLDSQDDLVVPNRGLDGDGNLYRGEHDADLRWEGWNPDAYRTDALGRNGYSKENNEEEDFWDDLIRLVDVLNNYPDPQYEPLVRGEIDEEEWAGFFAAHTALGNREGGIYRDTGDDYYLTFNPPGDTDGFDARMIPWDLDAVLQESNETIWRQNVNAVRRWIRHDAFAPLYLSALRGLLDGEFSQAQMDALIDAQPDNGFATAGGSDTSPITRQQFKNWTASRRAYIETQLKDQMTLTGVPASPYTDPNPVIALSGDLEQGHVFRVTVDDQDADPDFYAGTWAKSHTLTPGMNYIVLKGLDRDGNVYQEVEQEVFYNPPGAQQLGLWMRAPRRMVNDRVLTLEARIVDAVGRIDWKQWEQLGTVSAVRLPERTPVPITVTVFDTHKSVPADSIRFYNGWGSVSFTLDDGAAFGAGEIELTVGWSGLSASQVVSVVDAPVFRPVSGTLSGADLIWGPDELIRVTGNATVPSGSTLRIQPGTLVMVDTTGSLENGTLITINGNIEAVGTLDNPIYFFSERGALAMTLTQSGSASNANAWRGIYHYGGGFSRYGHVFLTGAGNGNVTSHPRPPILQLNSSHGFLADNSVFADNDGMVFSCPGNGSYTVRRSLMSRNGIGAEFYGSGHTLLLEDTWWTSTGWAPEPANLDGDLIHIDASNNQTIRRSIFNDSGDDGIDHSNSQFRLENSIIANIKDKAISMTGGHATVYNSLIIKSGSGIRGTAAVTYTTINVGSPIATVDAAERSIIWPATINTCSGTVNYTDVGSAGSLGCGTGNLSQDPLFINPSGNDFDLQPGSPALTAGPGTDRIGWLGFPYGATCTSSDQCTDNDACTFDECVDLQCTFTPIVGCERCASAADCDDQNPCTTDTCASDGTCRQEAGNEGGSCDDGWSCTSPDTCSAGTCSGVENCPAGQSCNAEGICSSEPTSLTFQDGVGGYTGTIDTYIDAALGSQAGTTPIVADGSPEEHVLIRFDAIFGSGAGQIPPGSTISSATLTLRVGSGANDQSANAVNYHRLLHPWIDSDVWATYGVPPWNATGGIQADGVDALAAAEATATMSAAGTAYPVSVLASLQAWSADPASNHGWVILPTGTDGLRLESSESTTVANRPSLSVTFTPPVTSCTTNEQCSDGLACNGTELCDTGTCVPGTPVVCDDGVPCTTDTCSEPTGACAFVPNDAYCDDVNLCTDETCSPTLGCQYVNNTAPCDDGNACTEADACSGGACVAGGPLDCDDGVACTDDACDSGTGCTNLSNCPAGETCNLGSGICETSTAPPLPIPAGAEWRYLKGTAAPPVDWAALAFDDAAWTPGPSGFGYGTDCAASRGTTLADMQNGYASLYLRRVFSVNDVSRLLTLTLTIDYDDGFVVYLNGLEVARRNVDGTPPAYSQLATVDHECSACGGTCNPAEEIDLTAFIPLLANGDNVVAIQGHNLTLNSSDFTILPTLTGTEGAGCTQDADCNDGNPCTDDTCNLGSGICVFTPDDGNACDDGIACTNDACVSGACTSVDNCPIGQDCNLGTGVCETTPETIAFQEGVNGYTGEVDTYLHAGSPSTNHATTTPLVVDGPLVSAPGDERQILLRFNGLFSSEGGPIPDGSTITAATLTIYVTNPSVDGADLHRMRQAWADTATWDSLVGGVQVDGTEAEAAVDASGATNSTNVSYDLDVLPSLAAWAAGTPNYGWVFVSPPGGDDSWQFTSAEGTTPTDRPKLTVSYIPPITGCDSNDDCIDANLCDGTEYCDNGTCREGTPLACDDGDVCNGIETCNPATGCVAGTPLACDDGLACNGLETCDTVTGCVAGTPVVCDDGVACTVDACVEPSGVCSYAPCSMTVAAAGSRYLAVTPPADPASVALRVTGAGLSCMPQFVAADGTVAASPYYQSSSSWAGVHVHGRLITPSRSYLVEVLTATDQVIASGEATTWLWGDANDSGGVDLYDILCILDGTVGKFLKCPFHGVDLRAPAELTPDGAVTDDDVHAAQGAFASEPYPDPDPCSGQGR